MNDRERIARAIYDVVSGGCDPDNEGWEEYSVASDHYEERQGKQAYTAIADAVLAALDGRNLDVSDASVRNMCDHFPIMLKDEARSVLEVAASYWSGEKTPK